MTGGGYTDADEYEDDDSSLDETNASEGQTSIRCKVGQMELEVQSERDDIEMVFESLWSHRVEELRDDESAALRSLAEEFQEDYVFKI